MIIKTVKRPGLNQAPEEITDWIQNLFARLRTEVSTLQCLCMTAECICDRLSFDSNSHEDLCMSELPVALWETKERLHTLINEINLNNEVE